MSSALLVSVLEYLYCYASDFDVEGIVSDLTAINPEANSVDDFDYDTFIDVVQRNDLTELV